MTAATDTADRARPPAPERPPAEIESVTPDELRSVQQSLVLTRGLLASMTDQAGQYADALGQVQRELAELKRDHTEAKASWLDERADLLAQIESLGGTHGPDQPTALPVIDAETVEPAPAEAKPGRRRESAAAEVAAASNGKAPR